MNQITAYLKSYKAYALYLSGFAILYSLFLFFEIRKGQYINANVLENSINAEQYNYLLGISKITVSLEYLITGLFLVFLVGAVLYKSRSIADFIKLNYVLILFFFLAGYLISISTSTPHGNNTQALVSPFMLTSLVLVLYAALRFRKRNYR